MHFDGYTFLPNNLKFSPSVLEICDANLIVIPYVPEKNYNRIFRINNFQSIYRINQSIISGYETITYYLHFAENPIRFGQVVTQKYEFS